MSIMVMDDVRWCMMGKEMKREEVSSNVLGLRLAEDGAIIILRNWNEFPKLIWNKYYEAYCKIPSTGKWHVQTCQMIKF